MRKGKTKLGSLCLVAMFLATVMLAAMPVRAEEETPQSEMQPIEEYTTVEQGAEPDAPMSASFYGGSITVDGYTTCTASANSGYVLNRGGSTRLTVSAHYSLNAPGWFDEAVGTLYVNGGSSARASTSGYASGTLYASKSMGLLPEEVTFTLEAIYKDYGATKTTFTSPGAVVWLSLPVQSIPQTDSISFFLLYQIRKQNKSNILYRV
jgi:hypothetical protein